MDEIIIHHRRDAPRVTRAMVKERDDDGGG